MAVLVTLKASSAVMATASKPAVQTVQAAKLTFVKQFAFQVKLAVVEGT